MKRPSDTADIANAVEITNELIYNVLLDSVTIVFILQ